MARKKKEKLELWMEVFVKVKGPYATEQPLAALIKLNDQDGRLLRDPLQVGDVAAVACDDVFDKLLIRPARGEARRIQKLIINRRKGK